MKKVEEPTVRKTQTVATGRIPWQLVLRLVAVIVVMSVVVLTGQELKHVPPAAPTYIVLHTFVGSPTDGAVPYAGLTPDGAGNLYGTTLYGGASGQSGTDGFGVVFKLSPTGTETVLYSFTGGADGAFPSAGLVRDAAGNLYGTTNGGGAHNLGVVFKLSPTGAETVLHSFTGGADGGGPRAGLLRDAARNLYGTTLNGGTSVNGPCAGGCGVVFKLSPCDSGYDFSVVYTFPGAAEGGNPEAGLIQDPVGNLYGTTGSLAPGYNVVFKLSPAGTETVLYSFVGGADGGTPYAGLVRDSAGNLYGTTVDGGDASCGGGCGVVFRLGP